MQSILIIDNYDSFTYNIVHSIGSYKVKIYVFRNDKITKNNIEALDPDKIIISPGPGTPSDAGVSNEVISLYASRMSKPILGICLGHQCIADSFGGKVIRYNKPFHGKTTFIYHDNKGIYKGIENPFNATRYHSLIVDRESLPNCLEVTAETKDGVIMGIRHKKYPFEGVQWHPESILTKVGRDVLKNFLFSNY